MKTTTSQATRAVLNERAIVAQWRGWLATQSTPLNPPLLAIKGPAASKGKFSMDY